MDSECKDEIQAIIADWLSRLTEMEMAVVRMRYGLDGQEPMHLDEIGIALGYGRGHNSLELARHIDARACRRLRGSRNRLLPAMPMVQETKACLEAIFEAEASALGERIAPAGVDGLGLLRLFGTIFGDPGNILPRRINRKREADGQ